MTWKGDKQRHSLAAKGVKTKLGGPVIEKGPNATHRKISGFDVMDWRDKDGAGRIVIYAFGKGTFGGDIEIMVYGGYDAKQNKTNSKVNWGAIGSQSPEKTKLYADALKLAAKISKRINEQGSV